MLIKMEPGLDESKMLDDLIELNLKLHKMYTDREVDWLLVLQLGQTLAMYCEERARALKERDQFSGN